MKQIQQESNVDDTEAAEAVTAASDLSKRLKDFQTMNDAKNPKGNASAPLFEFFKSWTLD